ncbi:hypothetical protein [Hydrogenophaga sp.]|uniref:hypothetical protein n=1 Tax=Hydrogenophaga sp. TaxID=1904254 RepID=UPI003F71183F
MCTGAEMLMMGGTAMGGFASSEQGKTQNALAQVDAAYERDAATQQADRILRAARTQKGAARAATAASGARLDEFSLGAEHEIDTLANQDAAMTILTGGRRAGTMERSGRMAKKAGDNKLNASLFRTGAQGYSNWKGAKKAATTQPFYDGTTGDFSGWEG